MIPPGLFLAISSFPPVRWTDVFLVVLMAIGVNLLYAVGRRKLTDVEKMRRYNLELKAFRGEMTQAMREGDKQKQEKLKKKQQQMNKMQMEMSKEQLKPTLLFMIPLWGVYFLMNSYIGGSLLAVLPIFIPYITCANKSPTGQALSTVAFHCYSTAALVSAIPWIPFFWWYMVCSFTFSTLINRLFGLTFDY
jgi:uncharacterized membrane protein (DUF106 family)